MGYSASSGIAPLRSFSLPTKDRDAGAIKTLGPDSSAILFSSIVFSISLATVPFDVMVV